MTQDDLDVIKAVVKDCSDTMVKIDALKESIKEAIIGVSESTGVAKKTIRKLIKVYYDQKLTQLKQESQEIIDLYEEVFER
jgi:hypothetical protein